MSKIYDYAEATALAADDVFVIDGQTAGTRKIPASKMAEFFGEQVVTDKTFTRENYAADAKAVGETILPAINHRNIFRGKNLGAEVTPEQLAAIKNGTFEGLYIGDFWRIQNIDWTIADFDYWYNCGDSQNFMKHHLVVVPNKGVGATQRMNETNTTVGGYIGSEMYTKNLNEAKDIIKGIFGDKVLTHREMLINAVTDGHPSGYEWVDSDIELMNEIMVYGCKIYSPMGNGVMTPTQYTIDKQQLALFQLNPRAVNIRVSYWLRDVVSAATFALVLHYGLAASNGASYATDVRPVFPLGDPS